MSHSSPQLQTLPTSVAWLGYGGLLPFLGLLLLQAADYHHRAMWSEALVAYGAIILSFVGALHWGFAMAMPELSVALRRRSFVWSVVPALIAWPASLLAAPVASLLLLLGFVLNYWQDSDLGRQATLPAWYLPLRRRLTVVAGVTLLLGAYLMNR